ncbi:MAG: alpha/beta fold hydrolase, partial [Chloroflexi bacterium]|nr:alpha/beta fold hydrolase [Chloroflexota bacterium]
MTDKKRIEFTFPVGYHEFHEKQIFNFQLNRWHSLGYARFEDMQEAGQRINSFAEWKAEMLRQAEKAVAEDRLTNAAFYYRAAEFYTSRDDPDKERLYDRFVELFYEVFRDEGIERFTVPYDGAFLPTMRVSPAGGEKRSTIVMHGGFDSFIEEFYSWMRYFADRGYEVIAFEGPGQGGARRKYGLPLDYRWELPTGAVLDYFGLKDVTLLGISMGGYLCLRAAALDTRIRRVIASAIAYDYMQFQNAAAQLLGRLFFQYLRGFSNWAARKKMEKDEMHRWAIGNLMFMADKKTPMEAMDVVLQLSARNLHSELVQQDVLILTGCEDHFIPLKMHDMQVNALVNAKSVTGRVFTREEQAQNHCQIGNIGLALDFMA